MRVDYGCVRAVIEAVQNERPRLHLPKRQGRLSVDKLLHMVPGNKEPVLNGISFRGNVFADANITVGSGSNVTGRVIAGTGPTGAVTMAGAGGNTIGGCASLPVSVVAVPTLDTAGAVSLFLLVAVAGLVAMRRRRAV